MRKKFIWTAELDEMLFELVNTGVKYRNQKTGKPCWSEIAKVIQNSELGVLGQDGLRLPKGKQCRERWVEQLDPEVDRTPITEAVKKSIVLRVQQGERIADIARDLNHSGNQVKNAYYTTKVRHKKRVRVNEQSPGMNALISISNGFESELSDFPIFDNSPIAASSQEDASSPYFLSSSVGLSQYSFFGKHLLDLSELPSELPDFDESVDPVLDSSDFSTLFS